MPTEANGSVRDSVPPQALTKATPSMQLRVHIRTRRAEVKWVQRPRTPSMQCSQHHFQWTHSKFPLLYGRCLAHPVKVVWSGVLFPFLCKIGNRRSSGECASRLGPEEGGSARLETGWAQPLRERETSNCFHADMPSASAHTTATIALSDATPEYCAHDVALSWHPPSCFRQWRPSPFTIESIPYSCGETDMPPKRVVSSVTTRYCDTSCVCVTPPTQTIRTMSPQD